MNTSTLQYLYFMKPLKSLLTLIFLIYSNGIDAQQLFMPDEVKQYMKKSAIQYQMDSIIPILDSFSMALIEKGSFLEKNEDTIQLVKKEALITEKGEKLLKKARKSDAKNNYSKALKFYIETAKELPRNLLVMNELADFYWRDNDFENVVFWAKKGIEINPIDFEAHARLALAYQNLGKKEQAIEYIVKAHLYNRNHPKVIQILQTIFEENGMTYRNFDFQPNYKIEKKSEEKISVQASEAPWQAYAACLALWQFDENYQSEIRKLSTSKVSKIRQKECLLNALIGYERMKIGKEKYPSLAIMGKALSNRMIDEFIFYEITLRKNPELIFSISEKKRERILRYLTTIRVHQIMTP